MKRGDVWWVSFDPSVGGEIRKRRPAVVVSNDESNRHLNRVQVVPLTSFVDRVFPSEGLVMLQGARRKALADQLTTASKRRLTQRMGRIAAQDMRRIDEAIRVQLALDPVFRAL